jgi:hypothetical protein
MTKTITLLLMMTLALSGMASGQQLGSKALVVEPTFDFGYIPQNAKVSHTYWVSNLGTDTLRIFNVKPGCGCTEAPQTTFEAAPDDSLPIELVFDSGRRSRDQLKSTKVTCNDPGKSLFDLQLSAYVYTDKDTAQPISITKNNVLKLTTDDLGKVFPVRFTNDSKEPLSVMIVDYPSEVVSITAPSGPVAPGKSGEIRVKVNSKLDRNNYRKSFTFELSDKAKTRFSVPIRMSESVTSMQ